MFDISSWELVVVGLVALVVTGPERLPRVVRTLGLWTGKIKAACVSLHKEFEREALAGNIQEMRQELEQVSHDVERSVLDVVDIDRDYRRIDPVGRTTPTAHKPTPDAPRQDGVAMRQAPLSHTILTRVAPGQGAVDKVVYQSDGVVALIGDRGPSLLAMAETFSQGTIIAIAPGLDDEQTPVGWTAFDARVTGIEGWLGDFRLESVMTDSNTPRQVTADIVIDLSKTPTLGQQVSPPGYLQGRSSPSPSTLAAEARELVGSFEKPRYFRYTPEICAHEIAGQTGCTRCLDVCAADAIRSEGTLIHVEPHLCQGCSACTLACPTGALSVAQPRRLDLLERMHTLIDALDTPPSTLHVIAEGAPIDPDVGTSVEVSATLEVPVIANFGEELWFAALAHGVHRVVLWPEAGMPADTRQLLDRRLADVACITEAMGLGRGAVTFGGDRRDDTPDTATLRPGSREPLTVSRDSRKRELLNAALRRWQESQLPGSHETFELPAGSPIGGISVDPETCVMCSVCARSCPTASIRYGENTQTARLELAEANCIQCGLCERLCPEDAITLQPRLVSAERRYRWQPLNEAPLATCDACGSPHMPEPLLESMIGKLATTGAADIERQFRRCPACRHGQ
ncbi:Sec-independent protein translocase protein TatB [Halomonas daqiaonensis]|uniref:Twin arginine-targeting protein translocase TatB n=1 Tax=Halomonas daqiaonensis TaxID=650850 RepID=A0A1H7S9R3_9GAMM|nr:Sec-independent protein translocase protein TatB [Halomonas daqiaonensis]SEL69372.1 twin arginine-targeting protein translocase TatB [Halomonas daqiaonensis]